MVVSYTRERDSDRDEHDKKTGFDLNVNYTFCNCIDDKM